jgi:hypothetical protein
MSSLAILIPVIVVAWLCGLALIVALCVTSARSDRDTTMAVRRAARIVERGGAHGPRGPRGLAL